jgi:hypothetical protein
MTITSSPVAIIIAAVLIALAIVVEPFVTDRGRFVPSEKNANYVIDTRTGCIHEIWTKPQYNRRRCP